jgi:hypothetical protein
MAAVVCHIVEHDGGWACRLGGVISEAFRTHGAAPGAEVADG